MLKRKINIKPMLPECSVEQKNVIDNLMTHNVCVDSVAGSGKTTTNLYIATKYKNKNILLLTYNSKLKLETRVRITKLGIKNLEAHSYHSFCVKYYNEKTFTDTEIQQLLNGQTEPKKKICYDIIIIDEAQDMNPLYYELVCKIYKDNRKLNEHSVDVLFCVLGDKYQSIYDFNNADPRYITFSDKLYNFNTKISWKNCPLAYSFRVPEEISNFVNNCMIGYNRIKSNKKSGNKPRYIICDVYERNRSRYMPLQEIERYTVRLGYKPSEIFILAPSLKSSSCPARVLENNIKTYMPHIPIYVPGSDEQQLDESVLKDKLVFSTFHQVKGLERKVAIVFNFDNTYFKFYKQDRPRDICPNELYVATTRALEHMSMIHNSKEDYLEFIDQSKLHQSADCIGRVSGTTFSKDLKEAVIDTQVTNLLKHLPQEIVDNCFNEYFKITSIREPGEMIRLPQTITNDDKLVESVSEINGIAIPSHFEYKRNNTMEIYNQSIYFPERKKGDALLFDFWQNNVDEITKIDLEKIQGSDILKIANFYNSLQSGYLFKSYQINDFNWLTDDILHQCYQRLESLDLSECAMFEKPASCSDKNILMNRKLNGRYDCVDNNSLFEFKCTSKLEKEHYLQLACYMFMDMMNKPIADEQDYKKDDYEVVCGDEILYRFNDCDNTGEVVKIYKNGSINVKNKMTEKVHKILKSYVVKNITQSNDNDVISMRYYLYNILSDQLDEITGNLEDLKKMMQYIIQSKFGQRNKITDDEFVIKNISTRQKYNNDQAVLQLQQLSHVSQPLTQSQSQSQSQSQDQFQDTAEWGNKKLFAKKKCSSVNTGQQIFAQRKNAIC
jgi:hypothetical protein